MTTTDYITDVTANLTDWGIDYRETTEGISVGNIHLEIAEDGYRPAGTILNGTEMVAITSDADKAAALLAFPLARKAWEIGYTGDFEVDASDGMLDMRLSYGSDDVTIYAPINSSLEFTVVDHPLLRENVDMTDLDAVLTSTELAYSNPDEAWQVLCGARDGEMSGWEEIVTFFNADARILQGDRYSKVESRMSERIAVVEDDGPDSPICVINVDAVSDTTHWSMGDVAAAVLYAIS
jgi:hypothetical protein